MSSVEKAEALAHLKYTSDLQGFLCSASRAHLERNETLPMSMVTQAVLPKIPYKYLLYTVFLTIDTTFRLCRHDHDTSDEADEIPPLVDGHDDATESGC
ncbi:hypothetical protein C8J57DRAFT_1526292 [Mycena rebaudengoi]|nr:hypothetical protein C8J57DRAFT_1526292 [Mycena rebaudengoi]